MGVGLPAVVAEGVGGLRLRGVVDAEGEGGECVVLAAAFAFEG